MGRWTLGWAGLAAAAGLGAAGVGAAGEVVDRSFDTAGSMFAYTEFELSGEPLAETLGLDLDVLDPARIDKPTAFDYAAGIESYEYSEEAMYALDYQSQMGVHLANGAANAARGGDLPALGKRFIELAGAVKFPTDELPLNLYPISLPYQSGSPEFAAAVDTTSTKTDRIEMIDAAGKARTLQVSVPAYLRDFKTLAWTGTARPAFNPGAIAAALLKETMWAQDFLGGMHTVEGDAEVAAESAQMDRDGKHALGVSSVDGMNGLILTEISWDKLWLLRERLTYDGKKLGASIGARYDAKRPVWFPHRVDVEETQRNGVKAIGGLRVSDASSHLRDSWLLLWALSEFYAFSDTRSAHLKQSPAFLAVFDGTPFPNPPAENIDEDDANDVRGTDPFSLAASLSNLVFENLATLHFDATAGSFVDRWRGSRGKEIATYDVAYALVALSVFQRAIDALPVGYASGDASSGGLGTPQGKRALELVRRQAKFICEKLIGPKGLVADGYVIGKGASETRSLATQFAAIRGLSAAFVATGDVAFRDAARKIYLAVEKELYDAKLGTFADAPGKPTEHTPWTAGAISGGLRAALLHLRNEESESNALLTPAHLSGRYTAWFKLVINGKTPGSGMQLAEWIGDSGENVLAAAGAEPATERPANASDIDGDHVPQVTAAGGKHGTAMTLAARVRVGAARPQSGAAE
jgi:hypothetical protein